MLLDPSKFYTIGHRGAEIGAVENTISAFELAIQLKLDFIELDIQTTRDGVPIVFHDEEMSRKTPLRGKVIDFTWDQIHAIKITTAEGSDRIPRLDDVFKLVSPTSTNLILELKSPAGFEVIINLIHRYQLEHRVIVDSFHLDYITMFQQLAPELHYSWLIRPLARNLTIFKWQKLHRIKQIFNIIIRLNFIGASFNQADLFQETNSLFHMKKKLVFGWGVKEINTYSRMISQGNNGFTAPDPKKLIEIYSQLKNKN